MMSHHFQNLQAEDGAGKFVQALWIMMMSTTKISSC